MTASSLKCVSKPPRQGSSFPVGPPPARLHPGPRATTPPGALGALSFLLLSQLRIQSLGAADDTHAHSLSNKAAGLCKDDEICPSQCASVSTVRACGLNGPRFRSGQGAYLGCRLDPQPWLGSTCRSNLWMSPPSFHSLKIHGKYTRVRINHQPKTQQGHLQQHVTRCPAVVLTCRSPW